MDEIRVKNLEVFCHHGVYKEENVLGQKFLVNIVSKVDTRAAGKTDELELSVSYGDICRCVKKEMTKQNDNFDFIPFFLSLNKAYCVIQSFIGPIAP